MVDKKLRTSFFVSLHQAFKSDFTHIISPNLAEFRYLISGKFKRIAKFFKQVDAKFIALGNCRAILIGYQYSFYFFYVL
jgi:hypothetical protein